MTIAILFIIGGATALYLGAEMLVRGASRIAISLGIPTLVVGLTIVSIITSFPEGVASLIAQIRGDDDIAAANVIGSNIANVGLIIGMAGLISPLSISTHIRNIDTPIMISTLILLLLLMLPGEINRLSGALLITLLIAYVIYRIKTGEQTLEEEKLTKLKPKSSSKLQEYGWDATLVIVGMLFLILGGHIFVTGSVTLAKLLSISERVIGLTLVAIGTSLPELATTVVATYRKHTDLAVGNVVGSNIFNSLFIIGFVSLIKPITFTTTLLSYDGLIMVGFSLFFWLLMWTGNTIPRLGSALLLICYGTYLYTL